MEKILLINSCVRPDSRTLMLAKNVLKLIDGEFEETDLFIENVKPVDFDYLSRRDAFIEQSCFNDKMFSLAKQFREAQTIVIAAPYWDLSFPSALKCYIESVCVNGLTFRYGENGQIISLCNCKRLIYVTTAGGYIGNNNHGYEYICSVFRTLFGVENCFIISAEGLDIQGNDSDSILKESIKGINEQLKL